MRKIKLFEEFVDESVSNKDILDLIDEIHTIIKDLKSDKSKDSKLTGTLFNDAKSLINKLHSLVESLNEGRGYDEARKLINQLRGNLFKKFNDKELEEFMKELRFAFNF